MEQPEREMAVMLFQPRNRLTLDEIRYTSYNIIDDLGFFNHTNR